MKTVLTLIVLVVFSFSLFGQNTKTDKPNFDIADFNKKFEVAQWLVEYDTVAWKTSDVVMKEDEKELKRLGREWFCFQDKNKLWHAVYGKFENDKYDLVFHYTMDGTGKIAKSNEKNDAEFLNSHARALATATKQVTAKVGTQAPLFNQYIKQNVDKTFSVWIFPAFQPNSLAVYGGEFYLHDRQCGNENHERRKLYARKFSRF